MIITCLPVFRCCLFQSHHNRLFKVLLIANLIFWTSTTNAQLFGNKSFALIEPSEAPKSIVQKAANIIPSARQLRWQQLEVTGFLHFGINTFTNKEWGDGSENPGLFHPTGLDARQWVRTCKEAGIKLVILTAKHHDGFCLWPSQYTEHSVKNSLYKNGEGDVVKEVSDACKKYGLKFGVYLSPWDRNHASYGKPEYITYYRNQLKEIFDAYGPVFEMWFDSPEQMAAVFATPEGAKVRADLPNFTAGTTVTRLVSKLD